MANGSRGRRRNEDEQLERTYRLASSSRKKRKQKKNAGSNVLIIYLVAVIVIAAVFIGLFGMGNNNDLIAQNVTIAGVDVSGMTKQEAIDAVKNATHDTYTRLDMIVQAMGYEAVISPEISGAKLDVKAAVNKAFDIGKSGSAAQKAKDQMIAATVGHQVDLSDCLNLNTGAIREKLEELGGRFSSLMRQTVVEITGEAPDLSSDSDETGNQALMITVGSPEKSMDLDRVYQQVLDAYSNNEFQVTAICNVTEPDAVDLQAIFDENCTLPVDAFYDEKTSQVVPGKYGYGFDIEDVQKQLSEAAPGDTITVAFTKITPEVTSDKLSEILFRDVLGKYTATSTDTSAGRNENLRLACEAINGVVLYPGDVFSYNGALGERTAEKGYQPGASYIGNETVDTIGGGICQVSSALYYCTLVADLNIVTRDFHGFATEYMPLGMDAVVSWGSLDFKFSNDSNYPIMIDAIADGSSVTVQILGTDVKDYYIKMEYNITKTDNYETTYRTMSANNENGYKNGDEIVKGYTGYDVDVYKCKYDKTTDTLISKDYVDSSNYRRRDAVICSIQSESTNVQTQPTSPGISGSGSGGISDGGGALPDE